MTIKGSLQVNIPIVKAFLSRNFLSPVENWPPIFVSLEKWGRNIKFCFRTPKGTSLRETMSFDVLTVKIGAGALAVG